MLLLLETKNMAWSNEEENEPNMGRYFEQITCEIEMSAEELTTKFKCE